MKKACVFGVALLLLAGVFVLPGGPARAAKFGEENYEALSGYSQVVYDYASGLPTNGVNDVLQTRDGYLWAAGYSGLIRYDGDRFEVFSPKTVEGFASMAVISLFEDSAGRLWVGTNDKGAMVYENGSFTPVDAGASVQCFAEEAGGDILVGAREGLFRVNSEGAVSTEDTAGVQDMLLDAAGGLWTVDGEGHLRGPEGVTVGGALKFSSLFESASGDVYASCQEGGAEGVILLFTKAGDAWTQTTIETGMYRIHDYCELADGRIWLCSDSGIGYVEDGVFYFASGSVMYSSLEAITLDHEGSIWIASSRNGLLQLVPQRMRDLTFAGQLGENIVNTAAEFGGKVYVGTDNKLQILDENYRQVQNELTDLLSVVRIRCMTVDSQNNLWIGEYEDYGLVKYTLDGEITSINTGNSALTSNKVRVIMEGAGGQIVAGTSEGVNILENDEVVETYGPAEGLSNSVVLSLARDGDGRVLVGTDGGGIFAIEDGKIAPFEVGGLDSGVILRLYYDETEDALWIATGASLYHYSCADGSLRQLPHISDAVGPVFDLVKDGGGRLWLLCTEGIVAGLPGDIVSGVEHLTILHQRDGLPYQTTANSFSGLDGDGNLFFCGTKGLGLIDVDAPEEPAPAPLLTVEQVLVDGEAAPHGGAIGLASSAKRLTVRAITPTFSPRSEISVEYYLEGFDDGWQPQSAEGGSEITYTSLAGGDYTLHLRAKNGDGAYSSEQTIPISKEYAPLERPWVIGVIVLACVVLAILIVYLVMRARAQKLLRRQQEYKRITDQTISTISNAIDAKDAYTEGHSERVAGYSVEIGRRLGMSEEELEQLRYIALLHDIGKIGISDLILNKPGRLTDDEFLIMKSHTSVGGDILRDLTAIENISEGASGHHEKFDGSGYPQGLQGEEISLTSRIIGVCDTYDAMATARSYKDPLPKDHIIAELTRCSGTQFDPAIAAIMIGMIDEDFRLD